MFAYGNTDDRDWRSSESLVPMSQTGNGRPRLILQVSLVAMFGGQIRYNRSLSFPASTNDIMQKLERGPCVTRD